MWLCMYCSKETKIGGWVDDKGVGYGPNCWSFRCEERAEKDAARQREAMKKHDE